MRRTAVLTAVAGLAVAVILAGCAGAGAGAGGSGSDPFEATEYASVFVIGSTKEDGSPIASNANTGFNNQADIAVSEDHFFVADRNNDRVSKFTRDGQFVQKWSLTSSDNDGEAPRGVALADPSTLLVSKYADNNIADYGTSGSLDTNYRVLGSDSFHRVAVDSSYVYVADTADNRILRFELGVTDDPQATLGGGPGWDTNPTAIDTGAIAETGDGYFDGPEGVAVDAANGYLYVADTQNDRIQKFELSTGTFVTEWGQQGTAVADFALPTDVAVDPNGNVYVADSGNRRIQKFEPDGTFIAAFGSTGTDAGELRVPAGIAIDDTGNIYVAEETPNHRVQKFEPVE